MKPSCPSLMGTQREEAKFLYQTAILKRAPRKRQLCLVNSVLRQTFILEFPTVALFQGYGVDEFSRILELYVELMDCKLPMQLKLILTLFRLNILFNRCDGGKCLSNRYVIRTSSIGFKFGE